MKFVDRRRSIRQQPRRRPLEVALRATYSSDSESEPVVRIRAYVRAAETGNKGGRPCAGKGGWGGRERGAEGRLGPRRTRRGSRGGMALAVSVLSQGRLGRKDVRGEYHKAQVVEIRFIEFRLISRVDQSKLSPPEDLCPSPLAGSTTGTSATTHHKVTAGPGPSGRGINQT